MGFNRAELGQVRGHQIQDPKQRKSIMSQTGYINEEVAQKAIEEHPCIQRIARKTFTRISKAEKPLSANSYDSEVSDREMQKKMAIGQGDVLNE